MENKPAIRFNYNDEWSYKPLKKCINSITTGKLDANAAVRNGKYKFFTCSRDDYLTNTYTFDGDAVIINGNGDLGITKTYSGKFDAYQRTYVLMDFIDDFEYIGKAIPKYLPDRIKKEAIGGAMPYIKLDTLTNLLLSFPSKPEQKNIAKFLSNLDKIIDNKKQQLEKTKLYKSSMLSKMFPKEGSLVPEIRFKEFVDEWNAALFGENFEKLSNNSFSRDLLNYKNGDFKNIHYGDILIKYGFSISVNDNVVPFINNEVEINQKLNDYLKTGDVVFADTAEDTTAGKMVEIFNDNNIKVISGLHTYPCRPLIKFYKGFLGIMLNTPYFHNQLVPYMQGTKVTGFNYNYLCKINIVYPTIDEQEKIVSFFTTLDEMISNQEKEIETLEHLKKTLLNKMFA